MILRQVLLLLLRHEVRFRYPSLTRLGFHIFSCYLTLLVLWFTSLALGKLIHTETLWGARNYFEYLFLGDLLMILPLAFTEAPLKSIRFAANEGILEDFFLHPKGSQLPILGFTFSLMSYHLFHFFITLVLAVLFFDFRMELGSALGIAGLILVSLPLFLGLGMVVGAVFLRTGRGEGVLNQILYVATVFAGVYFPLSVLPEIWQSILSRLSPFTAFLQGARGIAAGHTTDGWQAAAALFIVGVVLICVGWLALKCADQKTRKRGLPPLSHP